jgi:hypothetical protein
MCIPWHLHSIVLAVAQLITARFMHQGQWHDQETLIQSFLTFEIIFLCCVLISPVETETQLYCLYICT